MAKEEDLGGRAVIYLIPYITNRSEQKLQKVGSAV